MPACYAAHPRGDGWVEDGGQGRRPRRGDRCRHVGATLTIFSAAKPDKGEATVAAEKARHAGSGVAIDTKVVQGRPRLRAHRRGARGRLRPAGHGQQGHDRAQPLLQARLGPGQGVAPPPLQPAHRQDHLVRRAPLLPRGGGCCSCALPAPSCDVNVEVDEDGSGVGRGAWSASTADGIERIGGDLGAGARRGRTSSDAGWVVDGPGRGGGRLHAGAVPARLRRRRRGGRASSTRSRATTGRSRTSRCAGESSFASTEWGFTGRVDFSGGLRRRSATRARPRSTASRSAQTAEEIEAQLGRRSAALIQVRVGVRLPGDVTSNATTKAGNGAVWQVGFDDARGRPRGHGRGVAHVAGSSPSGVGAASPCCSCCSGSCGWPCARRRGVGATA